MAAGVGFREIVEDVLTHMQRYGEYAEVVPYNPTGSEVPHLVVLIETPKDGSGISDKLYTELKSVNMVLQDPEFVYQKRKKQIDFEPTYEGVLEYYHLPLPVLDRQSTVRLTKPQRGVQVPLDYFSDESVLDEKVREKERKADCFEAVVKCLDARQPFVYVPKKEKQETCTIYTDDMELSELPRKCIRYKRGKKYKIIPKGTILLSDNSVILPNGRKLGPDKVKISKPGYRQTIITKPETEKYWMKAREDGYRILRNDLIYHLPSHDHVVLSEVKPWSSRSDAEVSYRYHQLLSYHSMLSYFGDETVPLALTIPGVASPGEHRMLEALHEEIKRSVMVFSVSERKYFIRMAKQRKKKCEGMLELANKMNLEKTKKMFGRRVDGINEALKILNEKKDELYWYERALIKFS